MSCKENTDKSYGTFFKSYKDIPGVTAEEIAAIEALREQRAHLIYGMMHSTEAFRNRDGEIKGFSALFCEWLTELFGIPFKLELYTWTDMINGLKDGTIDFSHELTPSDERRENYFMTDAIVQRTLNYLRLQGSVPLSEIAEKRLPRYAFLRGSTTIGDVMSHAAGTFEPVYIANFEDAYELLKAGEVDALVAESGAEAIFDNRDSDVVSSTFFPLLYAPVSFSAQRERTDLEPIVSVMQKALANNVHRHLSELYNQGIREYRKHKLHTRLSEEEFSFIKKNPVVPFAAENDNYPISFYNIHENKWQGICHDVLQKVEDMTGLEFAIFHDQNTRWPELLRALESGEALMISELVRTSKREGRFLWSHNPLLVDNSVLISKSDFRNIDVSEVYSVRVGVGAGLAHTELFRKWFPKHKNTIEYTSSSEALKALARGEVDMVMNKYNLLLQLTHYQELPYYKANIVFNNNFKSTLGFNKDAEILRSIIDKALDLIDTEAISGQWLRKTYDYRLKLAEAQRPWLFGAIGLSLIILILVSALLIKNRNAEKELDRLVQKRTAELEIANKSAEIANQAKSTFLATMSHEIRTPMNSIMGFAELAQDNEVPPQVKDYLKKITNSAKWLLYIVNDILDISKIEAGKIELESVPFNLEDIFSRCQSALLPSIREKDLKLSIYSEPLNDKMLVSDPVRLYQVIMNLLSNAIKFTEAGTIEASSTIKNLDDSSVRIYFEVKDAGIGMSAEQIEKIFDPFTQADSSTTRNYGGTGLGLVIAKSIVELMGGKLEVESSPGNGSTFGFEITFMIIDALSNASNVDHVPVEKPLFDGLILICDDNPINLEIICEHLARVGLKAVTAENGKLGIEAVEERIQKGEKPFDLILMDMFMPVMNGIEAASKIIALNTGTPIVAMTANIMTSDVKKYKENGMPDCLGKPFMAQELWNILLKYLKSVGSITVDKSDNSELQKKLKIYFVKNNQALFTEITEAIDTGDIKLAHRLMHTLKGNAGQIGKVDLQNIAGEIEDLLQDGVASIPNDKMNALKTELSEVLKELKPLLNISFAKKPDYAVFEKIEPMLENMNPEAADFLDDIRAIPDTEELANQIENYDFDAAMITLAELRKRVSV
ncbi:MAG: transporter substrate-binding domain-containing protein [Fibromonadaceae bacterium]|nr:transporter substrate-binding domain-containing protein [Fibromonadaceae bacterium]